MLLSLSLTGLNVERPMSQQVTSWSRLARSLALMLGFGGLLTTDAQAAKSHVEALPQKNAGTDDVLVRIETDRIYISERGGVFQELILGDTAEAEYLRTLLKGTGGTVVTVPTGSIIVANGGGKADGAKPKDTANEQAGSAGPPEEKSTVKNGK